MSFRKRNVGLSQTGAPPSESIKSAPQSIPGVKTSPITGHSTTSTGTASLDKLLGLGAGLALGSSLLIEEDGTTDFASALLRCYAAEGVLQGHYVFVVAPEGSMSLPGVVDEDAGSGRRDDKEQERMKIAWRYERLGSAEDERRGLPQRQRGPSSSVDTANATQLALPFCHTFDQTKRLSPPQGCIPMTYLTPSVSPPGSPFASIIQKLTPHLSSTSLPTRLIIPTLLSPLIYPPQSSQPQCLLSFLHSLRALLRIYTNLTILISYPLSLYPHHTSLTRWAEHLSDGVITLQPFPHAFSVDASPSSNSKNEEKMQGLLKVLKVPVLSERGVGVGGGEDMAFAVGRKRFDIRPFYLPPLEGEEESPGGSEAKALEF